MDLGNGHAVSVVVDMVSTHSASHLYLDNTADPSSIDDEKADEAGVVLWTCTGTDGSDPPKRGYYLKYPRPVSDDISSTKLRQKLIQDHSFDETGLDKLSIPELLELLEPVLREG